MSEAELQARLIAVERELLEYKKLALAAEHGRTVKQYAFKPQLGDFHHAEDWDFINPCSPRCCLACCLVCHKNPAESSADCACACPCTGFKCCKMGLCGPECCIFDTLCCFTDCVCCSAPTCIPKCGKCACGSCVLECDCAHSPSTPP